jgi:hypothetical protein
MNRGSRMQIWCDNRLNCGDAFAFPFSVDVKSFLQPYQIFILDFQSKRLCICDKLIRSDKIVSCFRFIRMIKDTMFEHVIEFDHAFAPI